MAEKSLKVPNSHEDVLFLAQAAQCHYKAFRRLWEWMKSGLDGSMLICAFEDMERWIAARKNILGRLVWSACYGRVIPDLGLQTSEYINQSIGSSIFLHSNLIGIPHSNFLHFQ